MRSQEYILVVKMYPKQYAHKKVIYLNRVMLFILGYINDPSTYAERIFIEEHNVVIEINCRKEKRNKRILDSTFESIPYSKSFYFIIFVF